MESWDYIMNILMPVKEPFKAPPGMIVERTNKGFYMVLSRGCVTVDGFGTSYHVTHAKLLKELEELEGD